MAGQRSRGRLSSARPPASAVIAPAAPTSANRPMSSWEKPYCGPESRNVTVVQKHAKLPNPQAAISDRQRSAGSVRAISSTPRSCAP